MWLRSEPTVWPQQGEETYRPRRCEHEELEKTAKIHRTFSLKHTQVLSQADVYVGWPTQAHKIWKSAWVRIFPNKIFTLDNLLIIRCQAGFTIFTILPHFVVAASLNVCVNTCVHVCVFAVVHQDVCVRASVHVWFSCCNSLSLLLNCRCWSQIWRHRCFVVAHWR